jgi:perosamine synthetase
LERWPEILEWRQKLFSTYRKYLKDIPGIDFQPIAEWAELTPWLFCITVDEEGFGCSRDSLMEQLAKAGIETRPFFIPIHTLPPYQPLKQDNADLIHTESLARSGINLPTYKSIDIEAMNYIANEIQRKRG